MHAISKHIPISVANVLSTVAAGGDLARGLSLDLIALDLIVLYVALTGYLSAPARLMPSPRPARDGASASGGTPTSAAGSGPDRDTRRASCRA